MLTHQDAAAVTRDQPVAVAAAVANVQSVAAEVADILIVELGCLRDVLHLAATCRELYAAFTSAEMWELYVRCYFHVTMANPPLLPPCLKGRSRFEYLADFDGRSRSLLAASTSALREEVTELSELIEEDGHRLFYRPTDHIPYLSLQRMIDVANELAQRGEAAGLPSRLRFSSATLVPGMVVICTGRPSDHEIERRAQWGQPNYHGPLFNLFDERCVVNSVVNGVVSLTTTRPDFGAFASETPWVYEALNELGCTAPHPSSLAHPAFPSMSVLPFKKSICVPRANVHHRTLETPEDVDEVAPWDPLRELLDALGQDSDPGEPLGWPLTYPDDEGSDGTYGYSAESD